MPIDYLDYARFSANVYGVSNSVRAPDNTIAIPTGWTPGLHANSLPTGFMARAYAKGNDIVISYAGTTGEGDGIDKARDWLYGNSAGASRVRGRARTLMRKFVDLKFSARGGFRRHEVKEK